MRERIGSFPLVSAGIARETAMEIAVTYQKGAATKKLRKIPTLEQATEKYLANPKLRSDRNKAQVRARVENHLSDWLRLPITDITPAMCEQAHKRITPNGAVISNQVLQPVRAIYNFANKANEFGPCPTSAVTYHHIVPSQPIIDDLDAWKIEVDGLANPVHRTYYRFLLTTGLRSDEAKTLTWDRVFDDHLHLHLHLHLPDPMNGRPFDLPLLDVHHKILEPLRDYASDWVFVTACTSWRRSASLGTRTYIAARSRRLLQRMQD